MGEAEGEEGKIGGEESLESLKFSPSDVQTKGVLPPNVFGP